MPGKRDAARAQGSREAAVAMLRVGASRRLVAKALKVAECTVGRWFIDWQRRGTCARKKGSGRPLKFSLATRRGVLKRLSDPIKGTTRKVAAAVTATGTSISRSTVHRIAKRAGRTYRVVKPKPYTTALVREARIAFSILRLKDNQNEMTRRLYLDEKVFVMGAGKKSVWVKPYEEVPTRQRRKIH